MSHISESQPLATTPFNAVLTPDVIWLRQTIGMTTISRMRMSFACLMRLARFAGSVSLLRWALAASERGLWDRAEIGGCQCFAPPVARPPVLSAKQRAGSAGHR